jgi:hypothetical protein
MGASELQRDGDDDVFRCCDDGDGGHATTQGCWTGFVKSGLRLARSIAQRLTAGRRETKRVLRSIKRFLKSVSQQISKEKEIPGWDIES